jgi:membrane protease YdiL (CAAX protease family)
VVAPALGAPVTGPVEPPAVEPEPRLLVGAGFAFYALLAGAALVWLWLRDRDGALAELAIGERGPLVASAVGLAAGWLGARSLAWAVPRVPRMRELEATAARVFARTGDATALLFVVAGAVAEELFFRLAVLDAFGWTGSVAAATVVNSSLAGWRWLPVAFAHALALAMMVRHGYGLLAATTASAVMSYLNLRRIQCS